MGESHETRPGEITPQNHIEKKKIYILHKENGAHFQTIFSQKLSIFFLLLVKYLTFTLFFVFIQILNSILTITV